MGNRKIYRPSEAERLKAEPRYLGTGTPTKYNFGNNLYLYVYHTDKGYYKRLWRFRKLFNGKPKELSLGDLKEVRYSEAREKADSYIRLINAGKDPADRKADTSFEGFYRQWLDDTTKDALGETRECYNRKIERNVMPVIGRMELSSIKPENIDGIADSLISRGRIAEAHTVLAILNRVFEYAVDCEKVLSNPVRRVAKTLPKRKENHYPAVKEPEELKILLQKLWNYEYKDVALAALMKIQAYLFLRPNEVASMKWVDVDLDAAEWTCHITKTKGFENHIIPLSSQVVTILKGLREITGSCEHVFYTPRNKNKHIAIGTEWFVFCKIGYTGKHTSHGWRSTGRTIMDERLHFNTEYIESQLGHKTSAPNGRAYNRSTYVKDRRELLQVWADYLDELRTNDNIDIEELDRKYSK